MRRSLALVDLKLEEDHAVCKAVRGLGVEYLPLSANVAEEEAV
jgi:tryptophan synthase alpha subunit